VNSTNSLVGSSNGDFSSASVTALTNGNYVVSSSTWDCTATLCPSPAIAAAVTNVGSVTWASGTTGITGPVTSANSLVGSTASDGIGTVNALPNGNYLVNSAFWNCNAVLCPSALADVGSLTWGSGSSGVTGPVGPLNSLVGGTVNDQLGIGTKVSLTNGHVIVRNTVWGASDLGLIFEMSGTAASSGRVIE
jgi:hypothetical protein